MMQISENGLNLIKQSEGFRSFAYQDVAGKWTIGWGHLIVAPESFPQGITEEEGTSILLKDCATAEAAVNRLVPVDCNQNQFDALCDFTFNLGPAALATMLAHGWDEVPTQIPHWCNAGGKPAAGLVTRRAAEVALFTTPI